MSLLIGWSGDVVGLKGCGSAGFGVAVGLKYRGTEGCCVVDGVWLWAMECCGV